MKRPQPKFHPHTMKESQVIRSKNVKIYHWVKIYRWVKLFLQHSFFSFYRYFIETTTTDMDLLLQVFFQFCHNNRCVTISDVRMLLCPLLDD